MIDGSLASGMLWVIATVTVAGAGEFLQHTVVAVDLLEQIDPVVLDGEQFPQSGGGEQR